MRYLTYTAGVLVLVAVPLLLPTMGGNDRAPALEAPGRSSAPAGTIPTRTKEQNVELGRQHRTSWDLYQALKAEAKGGTALTPATVPDWSGVYSRPADKGFTF